VRSNKIWESVGGNERTSFVPEKGERPQGTVFLRGVGGKIEGWGGEGENKPKLNREPRLISAKMKQKLTGGTLRRKEGPRKTQGRGY